MRWLRNLSIKRKLALVIALASTMALLLACAAFIYYDVVTFRRVIVRDITPLADIVGANSAAALTFDDPDNATNTLAALQAQPHIVSVGLYRKDGRLFASYVRAGVTAGVPAAPGTEGHAFESEHLVLRRPIMQGQQRIGTIYLQSDVEHLRARLRSYAGIVALVLLGSLLATLALSGRLQRVISQPILALSRTAAWVSEQKNYSLRAEKQSTDEIGQLTESFNLMLGVIEERDTALQRSREGLEERVQERTTELARANQELQTEIAERERAQRRIATQFAVTRVLAEATTLSQATPRIVQALCESLGWDVGALWRLNSQTGRLHCIEVWQRAGLEVAEFVSVTRGKTLEAGVGLPGRVWAENQPAWIADVLRDQNFPRAPFAVKAGLHGAFGFPVRLGDEFLGVIEFFSHEILEPDTELLNMMAAVGSQIGQFIERRRAEAALKDSESLYHSLLEGLPVNILRKDLQGRFTFANQGFCADIGKSLNDILGKTDFDLFPPELAAKYQQDDRRVTEGGITIETVEEHHVPGGENRFVQVIKTPVFDGAGKGIGLLGIFWDVTDKRRAEQALEYERYLLRTLMDNLPDRIYFKDNQSRFLRVNQAMFLRRGVTDGAQIIGKTDFDFYTEEHARQAFADEQQILKTGQSVTKEEKETWPDGSVTWALSTKLPMRDERGQIIGTFGISRDITDRKRAEEVLHQAKDAAEEASRTKSQFLASMSHELRTPLNSVIGFANILLKNKAGNLGPAELNFLDRIQANGKHLLGLINQILDLSKIEARKVELQIAAVALDVLVRETIAQQESLVRDRPVKLLADLPAVMAPLPADADKLKQVIINLIGNALKFTEQGSVTVRVTTDPGSGCPLRIDVVDTGIGIPREKLDVIFEAFQQAEEGTARKYGGTGLGLTISQALCQLMGYRIEVASEVGKGSSFSVLLKPATGAAKPAPVATPSSEPVRAARAVELKDKLVLVIDDESDSRTLLTHMLEEFGCQVIAANSGEQGLRMAREFRPHVITVDLLMPRMNGWQVVQTIKAEPELRDIPVVVVSVVASENRGRTLGTVDVLQKPIAREDLLTVVQRNLSATRPKILVVDDEEDARRMIISHLEEETTEIRTAANGREALVVLEHFTPDIVLLDLMMPVMDGLSFLHVIRADPRSAHLPVVVITAKELTAEEAGQLERETLRVMSKSEVFGGEFKHMLEVVLQSARNRTTAAATGAQTW